MSNLEPIYTPTSKGQVENNQHSFSENYKI